jgi:hypothetical protein
MQVNRFLTSWILSRGRLDVSNSAYDSMHDLHTIVLWSRLFFRHQLQPLVNTFPVKIAQHLKKGALY